MHLYGLKNCDTCRTAAKALAAAGHDVGVTDVRADGFGQDDLRRFWLAFGDALINRRSATWRGLSDAERRGEPLALLVAYPTLMKRPVIEVDQVLWLGWGKEVQAALLG